MIAPGKEVSARVVSENPLNSIEGRPVLALNPGHGNEPYILAAAIGMEVSKQFVKTGLPEPLLVMPLLYGDLQRRIVKEQNPDDSSIYYDPTFGELLKEIIFGAGDYRSHIAKVNGNYDKVEHQINQCYAPDGRPFTAYNNSTNEPVELDPGNVIGVIEVGNRVTLDRPHKYFAFPELLSRVLHEALDHNDELGFRESDMTRLANRMVRTEKTYREVFIPWISTFSYQYVGRLDEQPTVIDGRTRIYTPPMKADIEPSDSVEPGVYVMFSGTSSGIRSNRALVKTMHEAGLQVYTPEWENVEGTIKQKPTPYFLSDKNILAILGRMGWGTGWQAMQYGKPFLVAPYEDGDDPEIFFNHKTVTAFNLGRIMTGGISGEELKKLAAEISPGLADLKRVIAEKFGTADGLEYMGEHIFRDLVR